MTKINMRRTRFLDGERIFRIYFTEMGSARSLGKVKKQLGESARNPYKGTIVTDAAIEGSMWRWAMNNLDFSYPIFNEAMRNEGKYHTFEEWKEHVFHHAERLVRHNPRTFQNWMKRIGQA